jgi:hypothetical protein
MAYPNACPSFFTDRSIFPKSGICLAGMEENAKITAMIRSAGPQRSTNWMIVSRIVTGWIVS